MNFDISRLSDPTFFGEGRIPAHSDHRWFASAAEAVTGRSSFERNLDGIWKFHYARNLDYIVPGFQSPDFDCSDWDDILVPAHIQLQGYDRPQYSNVQYPWDGLEAIEPGQIPQHHNPVGSYVTHFQLDSPLEPGERLSVKFHGAESAIALWLNGKYIGYGADSFTPSEFDLTDALVDGTNKLAAQVFRYTSGSWLEDQDFFRFSGIFRSVVLHRRPAVHAEDLQVEVKLSDDFSSAQVKVKIALVGEGQLKASLLGVGDLDDLGGGVFGIEVPAPRLWSPEDPHLYDLAIEVFGQGGQIAEYIAQRVGLRRFAIEDGLLKLNGQRVVFNGVNRHEFGLQGRVMSREQTEKDLQIIKANGLNALRTSHYPNNSFLYELCDEYGVMVIDEMNLESHGSWDSHRGFGAPLESVIPGNHQEWRGMLLDRAANMLERDKNHASIVMWSCGNESFGGSVIRDVADWFRSRDDRPIHYEGIDWDDRYPETTDVVSTMYTPASEVEEFLKTNRSKPYILCEYAHAMGNSFGAVDKYVELAYREPLFQGGFIWDFADQALVKTDRHGKEYFAYGGDFGDAPHDAEFSADGILYADHTPTSMMVEVKYVYRPLVARLSESSVEITNRLLFTNSNEYDCVVSVSKEGVGIAAANLATNVGPGETANYPLPVTLPTEPGEYAIDISFRLRSATKWAPAGHEVSWEQQVFQVGKPAEVRSGVPAVELIEGIHNVGVRGPRFTALFSRLYGGLVSYKFGMDGSGGRELLSGMPRPNFWHATTSNERGWFMPFENGQWLLASRYAMPIPGSMRVGRIGSDVEIGYSYALPTEPGSQCDVAYLVSGDGRVEVTMTVRPGDGLPDMPEFGALFATDADLHNLKWYGEGPEDCYVDRRGGVRLGIYEGDVATQLPPHVRPQESGSHTGVRWACVTDDRGRGLRFSAETPMEFSALPWTPDEIENARHPNELPPIQRTILRPALMRRGVGGDNSWGARTHPEYLLPTGKELVFRFAFQGI